MADLITNLSLGNIIQIAFSKGIRLQVSQDFPEWEAIKMMKESNAEGREKRFYFQNSLGPAATQYRNAGTQGGYDFPAGQQVSTSENTAIYKELVTTVSLEQNLYKRAQQSPMKYAEPLSNEFNSKMISQKRRMAADVYGDGTGVMGTVASAAVTSPASNQVVFTLSSSATARGYAGFFEFDDLMILRSNSGSASALDTNLGTEPIYWKVIDKNYTAGTVTLQGLTSTFAPVATISSISVQPTAGDVFYRYGQGTIPDLSSSIADYGTATEVVAGLLSLIASDARVIHGITMSGSRAATISDAGGDALDVSQVHTLLDNIKRRVGQGQYSYNKMTCSAESQKAFIESRESDRRFISIDDTSRGVKKFAYQHGNDSVVVNAAEFCPQKQLYILPEPKSGNRVLEYWGSDFEIVKAKDGDEWRLEPSANGGFKANMVLFMQMMGVLINKHPAACGRLQNFTI